MDEHVAWVGRAPRSEPPALIDPETGRAPRSRVGRERAEQAAAEAEAARAAEEAAAGIPSADAAAPEHT